MYKIGRSGGYGLDISDEGFASVKESGMNFLEYSAGREPYTEARDFAKLANKYDIKLWTCHLPYRPYERGDGSSPNREIRKAAFARFSEEIKKAAAVGIDKVVHHPGTPFLDESERPERLKYATEFANELAELAAREGAVVAVEDMPHCIGRSIDELETILSANDKLRICFDANHLLNDTHSDFIDRLGDKIITVHFSDYDFVEEKHWFPTDGKIDWVPLIKKLYGAGYNGPWMYECSLKQRTNKDFYDTAVRILKEAGVPENM